MVQSVVKNKYILALLIGIISFILGKYSNPSKIEIKEIEKVVTIEKQSSDKDEKGIVYEKEIIKEDGTKEITRTKIYQTQETIKKESFASRETFKSIKKSFLPEHQVGLLYTLKDNDYGITYQKRIFSSLYIGGYFINGTEKQYGLNVSLGF